MMLRTPTTTLFPYTTLFRSLDRFRDELGGVERRVVLDVLGKSLRQRRHLFLDRLLDLKRVGTGRLEHADAGRSEEHTSELQSHHDLVCRLLLEKKNIRRLFY